MRASAKVELQLPFADDSAIRRIHNESILLGGGRALLLQVAHPSVAKGVAEHSGFQHDRLQRLLRTLRPIYAIAFGTREQAESAAASINRTHDRVHGEGYDAHDPDLLLWVWATLVDTALLMHNRFVRPLSAAEATAYYEDMKTLAGILEVPAEVLPRDLAAFRVYFDANVALLVVSRDARRIAGQIFRPWPPQWLAMPLLVPMTSGLLPPSVRAQYGLSWGPKRQRALEGAAAVSRRMVPLLPRSWRRPPAFFMPPKH